ncbi:MAG: papain-like cysteine protease family protein [Acidobacteriota bacterium]|nr:papain-like cysteine protease family protein [Acidobacteriota bacterium]
MSRIPLSLLETQPVLATLDEMHIVPIIYHDQLMDGWCWAATLEMVVDSLTLEDVAQCTFANLEFQRDDCCPTNPECDQGVALQEFPGILMNWGINADYEQRPLNFDELKGEIAAGRPVIYSILFVDGTTHTGIVSGTFEPDDGEQLVYFLDPDAAFFREWGRPPEGWITYTSLLNGYGLPGNWYETVWQIRKG